MATIVADAFGFDLASITETLYADAAKAGDFTIDTTDPENPILMVRGFQFPSGKDYVIDPDGEQVQLEGINVYAPRLGKFFIPVKALGLIWIWYI